MFLFFLFVIIDEIHPYIVITITLISGIFILIFVGRGIQRWLNPIKNIGDLNEEGWREELLNSMETVEYKIGFVGDIMKMGDYSLRFEKRVKKFFKDVNLIVGNLEGIITKKKWQGISAQKHDISILGQLTDLKTGLGHPPKNWLLCTSNNHSSDFGDCEFQISNGIIRIKDFNVFGDMPRNQGFLYPNRQNSDPKKRKEEINLVSGTMWNNQRDHASVGQFENIDEHYQDGKFNILYPHWHFENESYVRRRIKFKSISLILTGYYLLFDQIKRKIYKEIEKIIQTNIQTNTIYRTIRRSFCKLDRLLNRKYYRKFNKNKFQNWELIYGHHSHVPQPITKYELFIHNSLKNNIKKNRLLAFSGGNLTSSKKRKKHISGLIVKCEIGRENINGPLILGKVEWSYIINEKEKIQEKKEGNNDKKIKVNTVVIDGKRNRTNSFTNWRNKFWTNMFYTICAFILEFILLCSIFGRDPNFGIEIPLEFLKFFRDHQVITNVSIVGFFIGLICYYIYRSNR